MSGDNIVRLQPYRSVRRLTAEGPVVATLLFVIVEALMFAGMLATFLVARATAGEPWPPVGQPWFPLGETVLNSAALLASGGLVFRASLAWRNPEVRIGPQLLAAIFLGAFFLFFQGVVWFGLIREGLDPTPSHHGKFFCLIVGMHAATVLAGLALLVIAWLRLQPLRDDVPAHGSLQTGTFTAVRFFWYFAVGSWPVLCLLLYL